MASNLDRPDASDQPPEPPKPHRPRRPVEELPHLEEQFRLMVEAVRDYAIFMLDPDGYIASWNTGAERIKGYKAEEIIGHHFSIFYPADALKRGWPDQELEIARDEGRLEDEGWRLRKDGSRFWSNVVITALRDGSGELVGFTKVTRDLTERRRIESLELAERRMTEFLAMLSHELRNPLAPIRNAVSTMYLKEVEDPELRRARDVVDRQVNHLTRLIEDLLDINRITSGTIRLKQEPFALAGIVDRAIESVEPIMRVRNHTLVRSVTDAPLTVNGDATRLTQVLTNLLSNAAKYTPEGGRIEVVLESEEGVAVLRIRDNGVGIADDLLGQVFDLFRQGDRTLDRSEGGLGIGLTLVRELVTRQGGVVEAHSDGPGRGSEFVVRLPLLMLQAPPPESRPERPAPGARLAVKPRVLVVDDNPDIAESMAMLLDMWGFDVRTALSGEAALHLARTYRPGIVLLDIGLPDKDGYAVATALRHLREALPMTLIALTGYGQSEDIRRSREAGFHHHLVKPADPDELLQLLTDISSSTTPPRA